jgi:hypothetical protein
MIIRINPNPVRHKDHDEWLMMVATDDHRFETQIFLTLTEIELLHQATEEIWQATHD